MEANVAVQLFGDAVEGGVRYSTYVGDDDSTPENWLQSLVAYDIEKWSDINHASRTLGSRLYAVKSKVKGLSPAVIGYMQRCFTYCIRQNKGKESSLLEGLKSIVPHAFGEHTLCKEWCTYKQDPENYSHGDLPGGRDLQVNSQNGTLLPVTRSEGCLSWFSYILHFSRQEHYSQRIVDELYKRYVTGIYRGMAYKSSTEHLSRNR